MGAKGTEARKFDQDLFDFLSELRKHNNRPWFQENKDRYERSVQSPAVAFIRSAAAPLSKLSSHLVADPRPFGGSLSRIYRDTRFAKDKSPYKTNIGIHFSHDRATKEGRLPGFFVDLAPGESLVASGIWHPAPPELRKIRDAIVTSPSAWGRVLKSGIEIEGESYARVPSGYDASGPFVRDLRRKDFYASRSLPDASVLAPDFLTTFVTACRELNPLNVFLSKALAIPW